MMKSKNIIAVALAACFASGCGQGRWVVRDTSPTPAYQPPTCVMTADDWQRRASVSGTIADSVSSVGTARLRTISTAHLPKDDIAGSVVTGAGFSAMDGGSQPDRTLWTGPFHERTVTR